ncbi:hypothetical protein GCM10027295_31280 [Pseudaeromonas pectinilytica]
MARGINEVQLVGLTIFGLVVQGHTLCFDGDAAFALEIHGIKHLLLHLAGRKTTADLDQAVGESRLTVVDVRNNGEVSNLFHGLFSQ